MRQLLPLLVFAATLTSTVAQAAHKPKPAAQTEAPVHVAAMQSARRALAAFLARDFVAATALYGEAARLEPDVAEFTFGEARSLQERGLSAAAVAVFARVVALTPADHPLHGKAVAAMRTLQPAPVSAVILPVTATPPAVEPAPVAIAVAAAPSVVRAATTVATPHSVSPSWHRPAAYGAIALGAAAAAIATGLAVTAAGSQTALDAHKMPDGRYDLTQISYDTAVSDQRGIKSRWSWSAVAGSIGAGAIAAAIWWLTAEPGARQAEQRETSQQVGQLEAR